MTILFTRRSLWKKNLSLAIITFGFYVNCASQERLIPYRIKDKWGYSDIQGKLIIPVQYDSANLFYEDNYLKQNLAIVLFKGKSLLINERNEKIIPPIYESIRLVGSYPDYVNEIIAKKNNKYGVIDYSNKVLIPFSYDTIIENDNIVDRREFIDRYYFLAKKKNKYFTIKKGIAEEITQDEYNAIEVYNDENIDFSMDNPRPPKYDEDRSFYLRENQLRIVDNNKEMIDSIGLKGRTIYHRESDVIEVYKNGKVGLVMFDELLKPKIEKIILPDYDSILSIVLKSDNDSKPIILARKNNKITVIDMEGNILLQPIYDGFDYFDEYKIYTKDKNKMGLFMFDREFEIKPKYEYLRWEASDILKVKSNGKFGYIHSNGFEYFKD
jgi:hypothetical protein